MLDIARMRLGAAWQKIASSDMGRIWENPGEPSSNGQAVAYDQRYKGRDFVDLF